MPPDQKPSRPPETKPRFPLPVAVGGREEGRPRLQGASGRRRTRRALRIAHAAPALLAAAHRAAGRQLLDRLDAARQACAGAHRLLAAVPARGAGQQRQPGHDHRPEDRGRVQERGHGRQEEVHPLPTNQPALPTDDTLLGLLKSKGVEINAKAPDAGRGLLASILLGFGPTLLILGIIIFAMRRATAGGGALGNVRPLEGTALRGPRARHVRRRGGHRGGRAGARRGRRLPQEPGQVRGPGRQDPARRAAHRARRARARRCSPAPSPARRACRSSRPARASSWRRSWASAPRACAISSRRPRPRSRRSCSSTSSTRSAARVAAAASSAATTSASRRSTRS